MIPCLASNQTMKPVYTYTHEEMRQAIMRAFEDGLDYALENMTREDAIMDEVEKIMSHLPEAG